MIDWALAQRLAGNIARRGEPHAIADGAALGALIPELEDQIAAVSGLRPQHGSATVTLVDRSAWIAANIASFQRLLDPLLEQAGRAVPAIVRPVTSRVTGGEVGLLLGWMSRRVLGQYDLLLRQQPGGDRAGHADAVMLVLPNLATMEQRYGFDPAEFRVWVLIHELTHRAQFTGVPWMREYFSGLVDQALRIAQPDAAALSAALRGALRDRADARQALRDHGPLGVIASPEQRQVIGKLSGLMSLLEGHGDVVMTRAAGTRVPGAPRFERILHARRTRTNPVTRVVQRLLGIEAKLNQYAAGARFIAEVERVGGPRLIDRCWTAPEALPTMDEIRDPQRWMARCAAPSTPSPSPSTSGV